MKHYYYLILLLLLMLTGCNKRKELQFPISENVIVEECNNRAVFLGLPIGMKLQGQNIYISDFYGDTLITQYNIDQNIVRKIGVKGNGPSEILPPVSITIKDNNLYLYCKRNFTLGYFKLPHDKEEAINNKDYSHLTTLTSAASSAIPITDSKILSAGYYAQGRYAVLDIDGVFLKYFGEYPDFFNGEKELPFDVKAMFHQVRFEPNYKLKKVLSVSSHIVDIIDFSNSNFDYKRLLLKNYNYDFHKGDYLQTRKSELTQKGAIAVTSSDNYFYILYNPNTGSNENLMNEIWVFDWNGETVKKITPNIQINLIAAKSDNLLYAVSQSEEPGIVKLRI